MVVSPLPTSSQASRTKCKHCQEPIPTDRLGSADEHTNQFCCVGCSALWHALHEAGMEGFYNFSSIALGTKSQELGPKSAIQLPKEVWLAHSKPLSNGSMRTQLHLEGIHCAGCVWLVEQMSQSVQGVLAAHLDLGRSRLEVDWNPDTLTEPDDVLLWLAKFGYQARPLDAHKTSSKDLAERGALRRVGIAWALAGNIMLLSVAHYAGLTAQTAPLLNVASQGIMFALTTLSLLYCAGVILHRAVQGVGMKLRRMLERQPSPPLPVDVPLALGMGIGWLASGVAMVRGTGKLWFDSVAMLVAAVITARWVQQRAGRAARQRAEQLLAMLPHVARKRSSDGTTSQVAIDTLVAGDHVEVQAGEVIPADGLICEGEGMLNQSILTGESKPVRAHAGDRIEAGSTVESGHLVVEVLHAGDMTRIGKLMAWIDERQATRARALGRADKLGGIFVICVLLAALVAAAVWSFISPAEALAVAVSVLVITCPCALGMASPLALAVATGRAAKQGIFIKHDDTLDACDAADVVVFDKTGTLTQGTPNVVARLGDAVALTYAEALESHSTHPLAQAIAKAHPAFDVRVLHEQPGAGMEGEVQGHRVVVGRPSWVRAKLMHPCTVTIAAALETLTQDALSVVMVAVDGVALGLFGLSDTLRPETKDTVRHIQALGVEVRIFSGDHEDAVKDVAESLGLRAEQWQSQMTPEAKREAVLLLQAQGHKVVMVGDGVNDANALECADVGVAVFGGAHISLAAADVFLTHEGLHGVEVLFQGSRDTSLMLNRLIWYALGYNVLGVGLAVSGIVTPLLAAILMPLSSLGLLALTLVHGGFRPLHTRSKS